MGSVSTDKEPLKSGNETSAVAATKAPQEPRIQHRQWRNLYERSEYWESCRQNGQAAVTMTTPAVNPMVTSGGSRVLCPVVGAKLLACDDGSADAGFAKLGSKGLLQYALTGVSGSDWQRQRAAIDRAFGGGLLAQRRRHAPACTAGAEILCSWAEQGEVEDGRQMAAYIAARTMVTSTAGGASDLHAAAALEVALVNFFDETFASKHHVPEAATALATACEAAVSEHVAGSKAEGSDAACSKGTKASESLISRLLEQSSSLSRDEVRDNAHSALIAGFQACAVLLLSCLLELACHPELQDLLAEEARSKAIDARGTGSVVSAILKETLRAYPPISGLPRVTIREVSTVEKQDTEPGNATSSESQHGGKENGVLPDPVTLPSGHYFVMDLLAAAHSGCGCPFGTTWEWNPMRSKEQSGNGAASSSTADPFAGASPFGIGPRKCPAGSLTLALVGTCLHELAIRFRWSLEPPPTGWSRIFGLCCARRRRAGAEASSSVHNHHNVHRHPLPEEWQFGITHSPTLAFLRPEPLYFWSREGTRQCSSEKANN